jgi:hypothetical protein
MESTNERARLVGAVKSSTQSTQTLIMALYPKVLEALERGDLTLTAVRLLAPHLTSANHGEVLAAARHGASKGFRSGFRDSPQNARRSHCAIWFQLGNAWLALSFEASPSSGRCGTV